MFEYKFFIDFADTVLKYSQLVNLLAIFLINVENLWNSSQSQCIVIENPVAVTGFDSFLYFYPRSGYARITAFNLSVNQ